MITKHCYTSKVCWTIIQRLSHAQEYCYTSFSHPSAVFVRQLPCCIIHQRKRRRRRGNLGGVRVRIRREVSISSAHLSTCPFTPSYGHRGLYLALRSWDVRYACHLPIIPDRRQSDEFCTPVRLRVRNRGVNLRNIKSLKYVRQSQTQTVVSHVKMALVNARSVSNKTFILIDFFTSHELDFLFLTETWTGAVVHLWRTLSFELWFYQHSKMCWKRRWSGYGLQELVSISDCLCWELFYF